MFETLDINEFAEKHRDRVRQDFENQLPEIRKEWEEKFQAIEQTYNEKRDQLQQRRAAAINADPQAQGAFGLSSVPPLPLLRIEPGVEEEVRWETVGYISFVGGF